MKRDAFDLPRLMWITPGLGVGDRLLRTLRAALRGGLRFVQVREKASFACDLFRALIEISAEMHRVGGRVAVNERVDVALACGVDAVHLGQRALPVDAVRGLVGDRLLIGCSVHDRRELDEAVRGGADYLVASPVFPVRKRGIPPSPPLGLVGLTDLVRASPVPVFALGGIDPDNVGEVLGCGAFGVAVQRAIGAAPDPREATALLVERVAR